MDFTASWLGIMARAQIYIYQPPLQIDNYYIYTSTLPDIWQLKVDYFFNHFTVLRALLPNQKIFQVYVTAHIQPKQPHPLYPVLALLLAIISILKVNNSMPSRICYNDIIQDSIMRYAAALRHIYIGTIEDTTELTLAPLLKPLLKPLLIPLIIYSLFKPKPLPTPI